jgi:hypothetical protein
MTSKPKESIDADRSDRSDVFFCADFSTRESVVLFDILSVGVRHCRKRKRRKQETLTRREEVRIAVGWRLQVFGTKPVEEGHRVTNLEGLAAGRQLATGRQDQVGLAARREPGKTAQGRIS